MILKRIFFCLTLATVTFSPLLSKDKTPEKENKDTTVTRSEYDKLLEKKHETASGLFTLHKQEDKLYLECPLTLLGRDFLLGSTVSRISDNTNAIVGSKPKDPLSFSLSLSGKKLLMETPSDNYVLRGTNKDKLMSTFIRPVYAAFDVKAYNNDSTAVVVDATDLFIGDNERFSPFDPHSANVSSGMTRSESYNSDKSYISGIKAFEDNVAVKSVLRYTYTLSGGKKSIKDIPFTAEMTRSIVLLPEKPARPRVLDSRVSVFPTFKLLFEPESQSTKYIRYAHRWRLEPSDTAAFLRGELVEPVKPVVFYVDDAFPEKWIPYIKEGEGPHDPAPPPGPASRPNPSSAIRPRQIRLPISVCHPEARHPGDHALERGGPDRDRTPPPAAARGERTGAIGSPAPQLRGWGSRGRPDVAPPTPSPLCPKAHHTAGADRAHTRRTHAPVPPTCRTPGGAQQDPPPTQRGRHGPQ